MLPHVLSPLSAHCAACGRVADVLDDLPLCPECLRALLRARQRAEALCPRCLSVMYPGQPCAVCRRDPGRLISRAFSPYRYRGTVRGLILRLKFSGDTQAAALLAPAMAEEAADAEADVLIPVPLGKRRERERGYNQARLLAMLTGRLRGLPVETCLVRCRNTQRQSGLHSIEARRKNLRGAFALAPQAKIAGRRVLLVDDVRTSGATALACAEALRAGGAADVQLLCAAIAPGAGRYFTAQRRPRRIYHRKKE